MTMNTLLKLLKIEVSVILYIGWTKLRSVLVLTRLTIIILCGESLIFVIQGWLTVGETNV